MYNFAEEKDKTAPKRAQGGVEQLVARQAHILKVGGANPSPASKKELAF